MSWVDKGDGSARVVCWLAVMLEMTVLVVMESCLGDYSAGGDGVMSWDYSAGSDGVMSWDYRAGSDGVVSWDDRAGGDGVVCLVDYVGLTKVMKLYLGLALLKEL